MDKPFAPSAEENKRVILTVLRQLFRSVENVLEIGSGTGQHAVYFAAQMPWLNWQPSECAPNLDGIRAWRDDAGLDNLAEPIGLDVADPWPTGLTVDAAWSANTAHIMSWAEIEAMFAGVAALLPAGAPFALYGPFNYNGRATTQSNARFDLWLRQRDPASGIRDRADITALAGRVGLRMEHDFAMPANNRILLFRRLSG